MLYNMYHLFSFIVQLLLFLAQFVQRCTQYCTQGARPPSLRRCSCAQRRAGFINNNLNVQGWTILFKHCTIQLENVVQHQFKY